MRSLMPVLWLVLLAPPAAALPPPSRPIIARLLRQLGSDFCREREAAQKKLETLGEMALPALREAAKVAKDPEVRRRAHQALEATLNRVAAEEGRKLSGRWQELKAECGGRPCGEVEWEGRRLVMRPIKPRILVLDGSWFWWEEDFGAAGTYRAGPDGVLDMLVEDEDGVVGLAHNLYRLEGDILLVCYTDGAERPKRFETRPGTDVVITTFKRLRP